MKTLKKLLLFVVASALLAGCTSYKNVPYMQNPEVVNSYREDLPLYDAKIMPKDLLSITVNTSDPQAAAPFNLTVQTPLNAALTNINTTTQPTLQQYLVNNKGEIDFPVIGRLKVGGLTKNEAEDLIREQLQPYLKESPIVTVRMANYKISQTYEALPEHLQVLLLVLPRLMASERHLSVPQPCLFHPCQFPDPDRSYG